MIPAALTPEGRLRIFTGVPVGTRYLQGVRIDAASQRSCGIQGGVIATWCNGLPLTALGQLCYEIATPVNWSQSAIGFGPLGLVACDATNLPNQFANGMGYFNGASCIEVENVLAPPGAFNLSGSPVLGQNNIIWTTPVPAANNFIITKNGAPFKVVPGTFTSSFDDAIVSGVVYRYAVVAINDDGNTNSTPAFIDLTAV